MTDWANSGAPRESARLGGHAVPTGASLPLSDELHDRPPSLAATGNALTTRPWAKAYVGQGDQRWQWAHLAGRAGREDPVPARPEGSWPVRLRLAWIASVGGRQRAGAGVGERRPNLPMRARISTDCPLPGTIPDPHLRNSGQARVMRASQVCYPRDEVVFRGDRTWLTLCRRRLQKLFACSS